MVKFIMPVLNVWEPVATDLFLACSNQWYCICDPFTYILNFLFCFVASTLLLYY
jgi:hypothetical protein